MIEQETVLALIEAKEQLEKARDMLFDYRLDEQGNTREAVWSAHGRVCHAWALIESILAKGR